MTRIPFAALGLTAIITGVLGAQGTQPAPRPFTPVTDAMLANPEAGDWLMWRRVFAVTSAASAFSLGPRRWAGRAREPFSGGLLL